MCSPYWQLDITVYQFDSQRESHSRVSSAAGIHRYRVLVGPAPTQGRPTPAVRAAALTLSPIRKNLDLFDGGRRGLPPHELNAVVAMIDQKMGDCLGQAPSLHIDPKGGFLCTFGLFFRSKHMAACECSASGMINWEGNDHTQTASTEASFTS